MVISREVINTRLRRLDKALQVLQQSSNVPFGGLTGNDLLLSAVERNFQVAIECILDIGNHIIAEKGFESPEDNADIIRILGEENVIPPSFAERVKGVAGFRNILVHEYAGVDYQILYGYLTQRLDDLREFAAHYTAFLKKAQTP